MGHSCELVEALERRRVDFSAVQETRTTSGDGIIVSERLRDSIVNVQRYDDRLMKIVVAAKERLYHFFSAYAPQSGCPDQAKEELWSLLDEKTAEVPPKDVIIVAGNLDGHEGAAKDGYSCHGGFGYGSRNADGERILVYAESHNLTNVNTVFRKRDSHLISYYCGSSNSQIDLVLVKNRNRSIVTDAKIVPYERVAPQHRPLVCTFKTSPTLQQVERCGATRIKWWRLKEKEAAKATDAIHQAARLELGAKPGRRKVDKQTWLWTDDVKPKGPVHKINQVVKEKKVPECWHNSTTIAIWKEKGSPADCSKYRPIRLLSHSMKIFERILDRRIREIVRLSDNQCAFVSGCGTIGAIHAARLLVAKHREKQKPVHVAFLDLEKAFDRVPREVIWYTLRQHNVPEELIETVIRPVAMYGAECWPATKEVETRLSVMETKMLCWTAGVTRMDRIRNDVIRQKFGVVPIADKMREARLRWYGHVLSGKEKRPQDRP
ncbi:unnamed protein product [Heligmosomoides polygyrus]|uniref:Reverse transcriptase domain-containing protein n=1 Tax=Heligmosomoides polygyrus TaxID=6339 RepID=A0A183FGK5_HELPZ|nr:unnamed protein product [Heligmosomoides polygyrus]